MGNKAKVIEIETVKSDTTVDQRTFTIESNDEILEFLNFLINQFLQGHIDDKKVKGLGYMVQLLQTSVKNAQYDREIKELAKRVKQLTKGVK